MTTARAVQKKLLGLAVLPFAAVLALSACGDSSPEATNVNIQPLETPVEPTEEATPAANTELDAIDPDGELTETSFRQSENGVTMTLTYTAMGDVVIKQTTTNEIDYAEAGLAGKEEAQALLDPMVAQADNVQGYDQSIDYGETSATEEVTVDYSVVDMTELAELPGFEGSDNMDIADYISLEESRKFLEQQGFVEVE